MAKRDEIISELQRRITAKFNGVPIIEGTGGIWGAWDRKLPCIHIFEATSKRELVKPGRYRIELPIQIEYVSKLNKQDACNSEGRAKMSILQKAIELDERFTKNKNLITEGSELVHEYFCGADEVVTPLPGIVDVAVLYVFRYSDVFYGYEASRH
jgi:hypothetical protein